MREYLTPLLLLALLLLAAGCLGGQGDTELGDAAATAIEDVEHRFDEKEFPYR